MEVPAGFEPAITELQSIALATWLRDLIFLRFYSLAQQQKKSSLIRSFLRFIFIVC